MLGCPSIWVGDCWSQRSRPTVPVGEGRLRQAPSPRGTGKPPEGVARGPERCPGGVSPLLSRVVSGSTTHAVAHRLHACRGMSVRRWSMAAGFPPRSACACGTMTAPGPRTLAMRLLPPRAESARSPRGTPSARGTQNGGEFVDRVVSRPATHPIRLPIIEQFDPAVPAVESDSHNRSQRDRRRGVPVRDVVRARE